MHRILMAFVIATFFPLANAQVFKCVQPNGAVSYQDHDCQPAAQDGSQKPAKDNVVNTTSQATTDPRFANQMGDQSRNGGVTNYATAVGWYRVAAEQGDAQGQFNLGNMYYYGWGVEKDHAKAFSLLNKAAHQGNVGAQRNLAMMYFQGDSVSQNYDKAAEFFLDAANRGDAIAQYYIGIMCHRGNGVEKNDLRAAQWLEKSAGQNYAPAQRDLGAYYWSGTGVAKNKDKALFWFNNAADQNDAKAQTLLGQIYDKGEGAKVNKSLGVQFYQKAVAQNDADAELMLGRMYAKGESVPLDYDKALLLWKRSADQGNPSAKSLLDIWTTDSMSKDMCNPNQDKMMNQQIISTLPLKPGLWKAEKKISGTTTIGKNSRKMNSCKVELTQCITLEPKIAPMHFWPDDAIKMKNCTEKVGKTSETLSEVTLDCGAESSYERLLTKSSDIQFSARIKMKNMMQMIAPDAVVPPMEVEYDFALTYVGACGNH